MRSAWKWCCGAAFAVCAGRADVIVETRVRSDEAPPGAVYAFKSFGDGARTEDSVALLTEILFLGKALPSRPVSASPVQPSARQTTAMRETEGTQGPATAPVATRDFVLSEFFPSTLKDPRRTSSEDNEFGAPFRSEWRVRPVPSPETSAVPVRVGVAGGSNDGSRMNDR